MNPRLVKLAVELQTGEKVEEKEKCIYFHNGGAKKIFNFSKSAKVTIPVENNKQIIK